jgi:hypothetical protein
MRAIYQAVKTPSGIPGEERTPEVRAFRYFENRYRDLAALLDIRLLQRATDAFSRRGGRPARNSTPVPAKWEAINDLSHALGLAKVDTATLKRDWDRARRTIRGDDQASDPSAGAGGGQLDRRKPPGDPE